jgi:predicted ABC-type transport system involved in lysophospholipase L1 biosynthesis ATPase subunit
MCTVHCDLLRCAHLRRPKEVLFADEVSTGLDSSTTLTIVKILANFCHLRQATMTIALLQPAPEVRDCPSVSCAWMCDTESNTPCW